jgi:hypothetical protein
MVCNVLRVKTPQILKQNVYRCQGLIPPLKELKFTKNGDCWLCHWSHVWKSAAFVTSSFMWRHFQHIFCLFLVWGLIAKLAFWDIKKCAKRTTRIVITAEVHKPTFFRLMKKRLASWGWPDQIYQCPWSQWNSFF